MSGNPGKGKADKASAQALSEWWGSTQHIDALSNAALAVEVFGSPQVALRIDAVRARVIQYLMDLKPPVFKGAVADEAEADLDRLVRELVSEIRRDLGVDERLPVVVHPER
ncbi:hypothetical protein [Cellulosimicrobium sp. CUA-896]|uniref:hypothetical protein n=1 Tax=Cellulosimicrobium sp. CUA-896 TaxID=1517881 RepID=UPI0009663EA5|nr:hypothetical protein [Cellulosimicrobium sp. CUA-896]OLT47800.1 hypothetical protein BJF88_17060 [Cellulosimicrobium sp. CUA-896]